MHIIALYQPISPAIIRHTLVREPLGDIYAVVVEPVTTDQDEAARKTETAYRPDGLIIGGMCELECLNVYELMNGQ